jgi:peroxiredoxin
VELPRLEEIWQKYRDQGLSVVAVQSTRDREQGRLVAEEKGLTFHILENEVENDIASGLYRIEGNPSNFIIDREGRIVSYHLGFEKGDEVQLEQEIADLLASKG